MVPDTTYRLKPKQIAFLRAYLDPESQSFGNGRKAYQSVYDCRPKSAAVNACRLLQRADIRKEMRRFAEESEYLPNALRKLGEMLTGAYKDISVSDYYDENNEIQYRVEQISTPPAGKLIMAIDILNRLSGIYDH